MGELPMLPSWLWVSDISSLIVFIIVAIARWMLCSILRSISDSILDSILTIRREISVSTKVSVSAWIRGAEGVDWDKFVQELGGLSVSLRI